MTPEVGQIVEEIRDVKSDFTLLHSVFFISPDPIVIKYSPPKTDKECKSTKPRKTLTKR